MDARQAANAGVVMAISAAPHQNRQRRQRIDTSVNLCLPTWRPSLGTVFQQRHVSMLSPSRSLCTFHCA